MVRIGIFIKTEREACRLSQADLADLAGISRGYMSELESGKAQHPAFDVVMRLAWVLHVDPREWWTPPEGPRASEASELDRVETRARELARQWLQDAADTARGGGA